MHFTFSIIAAMSLLSFGICKTTQGKGYMFESMQTYANTSAVGVSYTVEDGISGMVASMMWWLNDGSPPNSTTKRSTNTFNSHITARQDTINITPTQIGITLTQVATTLKNSGIFGNDLESAFTVMATTTLCNNNPGRNVVVFKSGLGSLATAIGAPEAVMGVSPKIGGTLIQADIAFNAVIFQTGTFTRNGDGGAINLSFCGSPSITGDDGKTIMFI